MQNQTPVELRAPAGARLLEIDWADGHVGMYPHRVLRGFCPCAECQGHAGPIRRVPGGDLSLAEVESVGNYAIRLVWGDGHGTGIYSFPYLRELCSCSVCGGEPPAEKTFARG